MCKPSDSPSQHVVIAGAGPAGLLLAILLLQRNDELRRDLYKITLIESRPDMGAMEIEKLRQTHRSWMIALAGHGLEAVRKIPKLYREYVLQPHVGVRIEGFSIYLGSKEIKGGAGEEGADNEAYVVDRNFCVAALARYLNDTYGNGHPALTCRYETNVQYVDSENHRVLVRSNSNSKDEYVSYDLLVGADGSRSVVREALVKENYDFEMDFGDIFNDFRAVHVKRPPQVAPATMMLLPNCFPNMNGIALPMPDDMLNITVGTGRNNFDKVPAELKSNDPQVVAKYLREHFKAYELEDYDDFAQKWIANGRWNRTAMVHCNSYHSSRAKIVIMGDAAHATSPSIGMGMNTSLRDAQKLVELIDLHKDDLEQVLPAFSQARVKEGNSLTDLAFHLYCLDTQQQMIETVHMVVRSALAKWLPGIVTPHPQALIGSTKYSLADVYALSSTALKIIPKHRAINNRIRQEYFEKTMGMVPADAAKSGWKMWTALAVVGFLGAVGYQYFS